MTLEEANALLARLLAQKEKSQEDYRRIGELKYGIIPKLEKERDSLSR